MLAYLLIAEVEKGHEEMITKRAEFNSTIDKNLLQTMQL